MIQKKTNSHCQVTRGGNLLTILKIKSNKTEFNSIDKIRMIQKFYLIIYLHI